MKRLSVLLRVFLFLPIFVFSCGGGGGNDGNDEPLKPLMGMLQFRIRHNLQDDSCVGRGDCFYAIEEEDQTAAWLAQIAADSDLAVLHWDRAVPWLAFDADPPLGTSRTDFFDARIDDKLRSWINDYAAHFASLTYSYLAVGPLHGLRDKPATWRLPLCTVCGTNWSDAGLTKIWRSKSPTPARMLVPARSSSFSTIPVPAW
jgi:hypothetical protein